MVMKKAVLLLSVCCVAVGCSPRASGVAPAPMGNLYSDISCTKARELSAQTAQEVATLSQKQNGAATADAVGVFLLALPVGNLTGNNVEGDLAAAKGRQNALQARLASC